MSTRPMSRMEVRTEEKYERIRGGESGIMIQLEKGSDRVSVPEEVMPGEDVLAVHPDGQGSVHCKVVSASFTTVGECKSFVDSVCPNNTVDETLDLIHNLEEATGYCVHNSDVVSIVIVEKRI